MVYKTVTANAIQMVIPLLPSEFSILMGRRRYGT